MKDYGTWWITVPPKPMNWSRAMTDEEWAVERARHYIERRRARAGLRFGLACVLLISVLMWAALIEGGIWLLS